MPATVHPLPVPRTPDTCLLLADLFTDAGYTPEEFGPLLRSFGVSPAWKQRAADALERVEAESVRLITAASS